MCEDSDCSMSPPTFGMLSPFKCRHWFFLSDPWWALFHVFICHLPYWVSRMLIIIELSLFLFLNVEHFIFILYQVPVRWRICKYFLPVSGLSSFSLNHSFPRADVHIFIKSPYWFFSRNTAFSVISKNYYLTQDHKCFCMSSSRS